MGATGCLKALLVATNALVMFLGVGLIGGGVYFFVERDILGPYLAVAGIHRITFVVILIVDGVLCFIIGIAGTVGAHRASKACLIFYASVLTMIFFILVIAGSLIYGFRSKLTTTIQEGMDKSLARYNSSSTEDTSGWNKVQSKLGCCAVRNYTEYTRVKTWNSEGGTVFPRSCCGVINGTAANATTCARVHVRNIGCFAGVLDELERKWYTWGGGLIGIAVELLFTVILTCVYYRKVKDYETVY